MASNPYVNKVQLADGTSVIDISDTTAIASDVAQGKYFYLATGHKVAGTGQSGSGGAILEASGSFMERQQYVHLATNFAPDVVVYYLADRYDYYYDFYGQYHYPVLACPCYLLPIGGFDDGRKGASSYMRAGLRNDHSSDAGHTLYTFLDDDGTVQAYCGSNDYGLLDNVPIYWTAYKFVDAPIASYDGTVV